MSINNPYKAPDADVIGDVMDSEQSARMAKMASGQKLVIYAVLIYFISAAARLVVGPLVLIPLVVSLILSLVGLFKVLAARKSHIVTKIVLFVLLFIPLVNILVLLSINSRATKALREAGYKVGFMGAVKPDANS